MDTTYIKDMWEALRAELIKFRFQVVLALIGTSFFVLVLGMLIPKNYTTSVVVYVESTKIIEPLLKDQTEVTKIDRSEQASERIYTRSNLVLAARKAGFITDATPIAEQEDIIKYLRNGIKITRERFNNQFKVSYTSRSQDESFEVLNAIVGTFIELSSKEKQDESAGAYNFIDDQVQTYKRQLEISEQNLKEFNAKNTDGTEASVNARIAALRQEIEALKLSIEESKARVAGLDKQLGYEGEYIETRNKVDLLRQKRFTLSDTLEQLKLNYQERHPDVIMTRQQISELDMEIAKLVAKGKGFANVEKVENPLFEDLRRQYAESQVDIATKARRVKSLNTLLGQEFARQERIAANQAELSELVRDYDVTKKMYDSLVERKEAARLSMSLDVQGQSLSYRVREPAVFPLAPIGLRFWHLAILGPILGLLASVGVLLAYIFVDPRIRTPRALLSQLPDDIEFAGVVPHYKSPLTERLLKKDVRTLVSVCVVAFILYVVIALGWHFIYG